MNNGSRKSIWSFFIDNYRLTYVLIVGIVLAGLFSVNTIPKESAPEIDIPIIIVSTQLPGASAEDVEELVTNKIEAKLQGLADIDKITSISEQGSSQIVVWFDVNSDSKEKIDDVKDRLTAIESSLPDDATNPLIKKVSFNDMPVATFAFSGPYELFELNLYAEYLQQEIERVRDVSEVNIAGAPKSIIKVELIPERLEQYGLSASQVSNTISQSNVDIPVGSVETGGDVFTLRFAGRLKNLQDVKNISVEVRGGVPILLQDIANVTATYNESTTIARLGTNGNAPQPALFVDVFKRSGQGDVMSLVDSSSEKVDQLRSSGIFPEDLQITMVRDNANLIRTDLSNLLRSGFMTILIVISVLIIFLGWREALLTSIIIPLTFLMALTIINILGYTINFLTLFSLILALGILVDAGIVVIESMFEKMSAGSSSRDAAYETIQEFQMPLIAGTSTTIFVFLPMLLMSGIMGKFIESIPVTVSAVLISALIVSLGFITALSTRFLKVKKGQTEGGLPKVKEGIVLLYAWYEKKLFDILSNVKSSRRFLYVIILLFIVAITMPFVGIVKLEMFPSSDQDSITISLENPKGTPLSVTNVMAEEIEAYLANDIRVDNYVTTVGAPTHIASFTVNLAKERDHSEIIIADYEKNLPGLVSGKLIVGQQNSGPSQGAPIQARLTSESLEDLEKAALILAEYVATIPGTRNVENGIKEGNGELVFEIDRAKARFYGVTEMQVAQALRIAVSGSSVTTIQKDGEDIDVIVTSQFGDGAPVGGLSQVSIQDINAISVLTQRGPISISSFGEVRLVASRSSISHENGKRDMIVSSEVSSGANTAEIVSTIQKKISELQLPESVKISFGGEMEEIIESFTSLGQAMLLGILMILGLLIWQLNSYRQPFFIIVTIPLALIGVFFGLAITQQPLSFPGFIGVVALAGIVVNNAIILIDSINSKRLSGLSKFDAINKSAKSRLQPIILTTLTTVSGMLPLAFSDPTWAPLVISIVFGLLFSTVLTLFVIPILYLLFGEKEFVQYE